MSTVCPAGEPSNALHLWNDRYESASPDLRAPATIPDSSSEELHGFFSSSSVAR